MPDPRFGWLWRRKGVECQEQEVLLSKRLKTGKETSWGGKGKTEIAKQKLHTLKFYLESSLLVIIWNRGDILQINKQNCLPDARANDKQKKFKFSNKQNVHDWDFPLQCHDATTKVFGNLLIVNGARSESRPVTKDFLKTSTLFI